MRPLRFLPLSCNLKLLLTYLRHHLCLVPEQVLASMGQPKAPPLPLTVQVIVLPAGGGGERSSHCLLLPPPPPRGSRLLAARGQAGVRKGLVGGLSSLLAHHGSVWLAPMAPCVHRWPGLWRVAGGSFKAP